MTDPSKESSSGGDQADSGDISDERGEWMMECERNGD